MSRVGSTGQIRVYYVATLASLTAPSAATIIAGTDLTPLLRRDGLTTPRSGNVLDASDASTRTNKSAPGNIDLGQISLRFQRDSVTGTDVAWTLLAEDVAGYIVVRRRCGRRGRLVHPREVRLHGGRQGPTRPRRWAASVEGSGAGSPDAALPWHGAEGRSPRRARP
jgi:hypothetical protein